MDTFGRLVRLPLKAIPKRAIVPILSGPNRGLRWVVGSSTHGCWLGHYERREQTLIAQLVRPGMTVVDAGANVGFYTLMLSRLVGSNGLVIAFEPYEPNLDKLNRHLSLNHVRNVRLERCALSDRTAHDTLFVGESSSGSIVPTDHGLRPHEIAAVSLDDWLDQGILPSIDFIKMDIEGAEGMAILGMKRVLDRDHPTLYIALHGGPKEDEARAQLRSLGYELTDLETDLLAKPRGRHDALAGA